MLESLSTTKMIINVEYEDDSDKYKEIRTIDLGQYCWALINDSIMTDIRDNLEKQSKAIDSIDTNIKKISSSIKNTESNSILDGGE